MNILFAFGIPKSGTTFLQMILNAHPRVSCPPEHQFAIFKNQLPKLFNHYNNALEVIDGATGKQGCYPFTNEDIKYIFKNIIELSAKKGANDRDVEWYGVNDNGIVEDPRLYGEMFPTAKFIFIVRDPRSIAISSWNHNMRIEPGFEQRAKNIENWSITIANTWNQSLRNILTISSTPLLKDRFHICRYEDLVSEKQIEFSKLFSFVGVETSNEELLKIISDTDFEKHKDDGFFRKASTDEWKSALSKPSINNIESAARDLMKQMGYL